MFQPMADALKKEFVEAGGGIGRQDVYKRQVLLYFTILILLVVPGAVAAIAISGAFSVLAGCLLGALWNVLASLLILFCCRGLLSATA